MSKIVCEICGTSYQETAECCPICGCANSAAEDFLAEEFEEETEAKAKRGVFGKKKQIFDYDEVNTRPVEETEEVEVDDEEYDEDEEEEDAPRHNTFVVILLTVLIAALLLAAGFIFVRYFLPNMGDKKEEAPAATAAQIQQTDAAVETELRIPCDTIILRSNRQAELNQPGFSHLINVSVSPEDTTDVLTFVSADESVATVSQDGKITAVGEGETIVTISCGDFQMYVNVLCDFSKETEPSTEAPVETTAETVAETTAETAAATEAPAENAATKEVDPSIKLKLKKTDITLGLYYQFTLKLDCNLEPQDVEWSSEHPYIAKVDENGVITAQQRGVTDIIVRYGDQEVRCKVRIS